MFTRNLVLNVLPLVALSASVSNATSLGVFAESGFNDQAGVHSDPTPNSPYVFTATVKNLGGSEPGWNGNTWYAGDCCNGGVGRGVAEADTSLEGDGVLRMNGAPSTGEAWVYRPWGVEIAQPFIIEQHVRLPTGALFQSRPGKGGLGSLIGPHWRAEGGKFFAMDGTGSGSGSFEDTGFVVVPNQWHKVATLIDPVAQTYEFFVDDVKYAAPDALNFRGNPDYIDRVDYLAQTVAWVDQVRITVVPEPSALTLAACTLLGLVGYGWTRKKRS